MEDLSFLHEFLTNICQKGFILLHKSASLDRIVECVRTVNFVLPVRED